MNVLNKIRSKKTNPEPEVIIATQPNNKRDLKQSEPSIQPPEEIPQQKQTVLKKIGMIQLQNQKKQQRQEEQEDDESVESQESNIIFIVRKGYQIGKMSIFEGRFVSHQHPATISCKSEIVTNPQSIHKIVMDRFLAVGERQYLFGKNNLIKVVEKQGHYRKL